MRQSVCHSWNGTKNRLKNTVRKTSTKLLFHFHPFAVKPLSLVVGFFVFLLPAMKRLQREFKSIEKEDKHTHEIMIQKRKCNNHH